MRAEVGPSVLLWQGAHPWMHPQSSVASKLYATAACRLHAHMQPQQPKCFRAPLCSAPLCHASLCRALTAGPAGRRLPRASVQSHTSARTHINTLTHACTCAHPAATPREAELDARIRAFKTSDPAGMGRLWRTHLRQNGDHPVKIYGAKHEHVDNEGSGLACKVRFVRIMRS